MDRAEYYRRRIEAITRSLSTWRLALLSIGFVAVMLATTIGPAWVFAPMAWLAASLMLVIGGSRQASDHDVLSDVAARVETIERDGIVTHGGVVELAELGPEVGQLLAASARLGSLRSHPFGGSPAVTVVVPCFDDQRFLRDCLESVARQTFRDWECIVVDDASRDRSGVIALEFAHRDPRFRAVTHGRNGGLSAARNTGVRVARGPLLAFLDSDDLLLPNSLASRVAAMAASWSQADVAAVFCGVVQAGESMTIDDLPDEQPQIASLDRDFLTTRGECPFNVHAPLVRTEILRQLGGFDESLLHGAEDWDLWLRMMRHGFRFVPSGETGAVYRQRQGSMVKRMPMEHLDQARRLLASAHRPMSTDEVRIAVPFLFDRSVGEHLAEIDVASRVLQFVGIAAVNGDEDDLERFIAELPDVPLEVLRRHINVLGKITEGVRRALSVGPSAYEPLAAPVDEVAKRALARVERSLRSRSMAISPVDVPVVDVLVVAESAGQVGPLLEVAACSEDTVFALVDRVSGDQGVAALLTAAGVTAASVGALELAGQHHRLLLTAKPYGAAVADLVSATEQAGGTVVIVDAVHVGHVEGNALHDARSVPVEEAKALVALDRSGSGAPLHTRVFEATPPDGLAAREEYPGLAFDGARLAELRNSHGGQRCVIVGNGPSLNELDLAAMGETPFFAVNGIFHAVDRLPGPPTFFVVEDNSVAKENTDQIRDFVAQRKFFPSIYRSMFGESPDTYYFRMNRGFYAAESPHYCIPRFSTDAAQRVFCGQSVTIINLQLAYHLGFAEVVLIGMDFSYVIPSDADRSGDLIVSRSDDPNHFHPDYFGKGKTWKDPKLERVLANYELAKSVFEADGRRIVNATAGGALEVFDRVEYASLFG